MLINIKKQVFKMLDEEEDSYFINNLIDYLLVIMILISASLVFLESLPDIPNHYLTTFHKLERIFTYIFLVEYVLRIWIADLHHPQLGSVGARVKYITSFNGVIDVLALIPFFVPYVNHIDLRIFRLARLLRLTRFLNINQYTELLGTVFKRKAPQLLASTFIVFILMLIAGVIIYDVEKIAQPTVFSSPFNGLWWAVSTLTTIGYGDIYPITITGKALGAMFSLLGIGIVAIPTGIISAGFIEVAAEKRIAKKQEESLHLVFCPYCGEKLPEDHAHGEPS